MWGGHQRTSTIDKWQSLVSFRPFGSFDGFVVLYLRTDVMMVDVLTDVRCWLNESGDVQLFLQARCAKNGPALDAPRGRVGEAF